MPDPDFLLIEARRYGWLYAEDTPDEPRPNQGFDLADLEPQIASGGLYAPLTQILSHWRKGEESAEMKSALLHCIHYLGVPGSPKAILNEIAGLGGNRLLTLEHGLLWMEDIVDLTSYRGENWWDKDEMNEELVDWAMHEKYNPQAALFAIVLVRQLMIRKMFSLAWLLWDRAICDRFVPGICWWTFCGIKLAEGDFDIPQEASVCGHAILRGFIASNYQQISEQNPNLAFNWAERQLYMEPHSGVDRILVRHGPKNLRWSFAKRHFSLLKFVPAISNIEIELGVHRYGFKR